MNWNAEGQNLILQVRVIEQSSFKLINVEKERKTGKSDNI